MKILGIDPGCVNMGYCIVIDGKIFKAGVVKLNRKNTFLAELRNFSSYLETTYGPFDNVLIERQMRAKFKVCAAHLNHLFQNAIIIAPQTIKRYFNYSGLKSYDKRKEKGVEIMKKICRENKQMHIFEKILKSRGNKMDDIADAFLFAYYGYAENKVVTKKMNKEQQNNKEWCSTVTIFEV